MMHKQSCTNPTYATKPLQTNKRKRQTTKLLFKNRKNKQRACPRPSENPPPPPPPNLKTSQTPKHDSYRTVQYCAASTKQPDPTALHRTTRCIPYLPMASSYPSRRVRSPATPTSTAAGGTPASAAGLSSPEGVLTSSCTTGTSWVFRMRMPTLWDSKVA